MTVTTARRPAWQLLGKDVNGAMTASEAIALGGLDWDVAVTDEPITSRAHDGGLLTKPNKYLSYRTDTNVAFGVVGKGYTPVQNREAFTILDNIVDESGAHYETVGVIDGGARQFVAMRLPNDILVGGHDPVGLYLLGWNSHDGSTSFGLSITPTRIWCTNQIPSLIRSKATVKLRHTKNVANGLLQARDALGVTFAAVDEFSAAAEKLVATPMDKRQYVSFVNKLVPMGETKAGRTTAAKRREALYGMWGSPSNENIKGTRWAAYNAVTEWAQWEQGVRSGKGLSGEELRATRTITGANDRLGRKALALLK